MTTITVEQLRSIQQRNSSLVLVNTLPAEHFAGTQIPGAINIPQDRADFVERIERTSGSKDKPIVVYCASSECTSSSEAARKLEQAGFTSVFDFEGGHAAWKSQEQNAPAHVAAPGG